MSIKVVKNNCREWRPFRFPPLPDRQGQAWVDDPVAVQRAVADGFQEGNEKGYLEGLAQGREQGQRDGLESGREDGLREGRLEGRQAFDQASAPLEAITRQFSVFFESFELKRRQELLALVKKVAEQVIRCELTLNPAQLLALVEEALAGMAVEMDDMYIQLHPQEYAQIKDLAPDRAEAWRLVADETLALGECRIVTPQAEVDVGCQQRLDACVKTLSGHLQLTEE
ncbi:flagellar assembly protein FliH [Pseudomonas plecoglossicida]|uniref:Flagellar assembly protein FliH n=1 Tax=Pseudomonas plecoglossicida TaxID=70775 RepID=A0AAD0R0A0_PSEDL|nr:flagellar assembly protein FliH [Pseudomonas plecoglossicida]AXM98870.1 flagellar assembly protein H [Pseudomonas plecoglossicida]QLB55017.1 flagellar assembly protein H [Pseudomonas plecoglossicida]